MVSCLLRHALDSLKQASCAWFAKFGSCVSQFGFISSSHDSSLFIHHIDKGIVLFLLYVNDMITIGANSKCIFDL